MRVSMYHFLSIRINMIEVGKIEGYFKSPYMLRAYCQEFARATWLQINR